jgi:hydroxymethylbilane synthase
VPMGAHATCIGDLLNLKMVIVHPNGRSIVKGERTSSHDNAESLGRGLCETLLNEGGRELLDVRD